MSAKQFDMRKGEWIVEGVNTLSLNPFRKSVYKTFKKVLSKMLRGKTLRRKE